MKILLIIVYYGCFNPCYEISLTNMIKTLFVELGFIHNTNSYHYLNQQICHQLKGGVCMLPWHAIPFLKGLGMQTPNPWENG